MTWLMCRILSDIFMVHQNSSIVERCDIYLFIVYHQNFYFFIPIRKKERKKNDRKMHFFFFLLYCINMKTIFYTEQDTNYSPVFLIFNLFLLLQS